MRKKITFIGACVALIGFLTISCSKQELDPIFEDNTSVESVMTRSAVFEQPDSIIQFKGNRARSSTMYYDQNIWEELYSIRELPINIIAKENILGGGRFFTTQGNEVI